MKQILVGGRYLPHHSLGGGGMAEVFLARDEVLDRDVALKVLKTKYAENEEFIKRFRREARSAASLNHPHIVAVYDWGRSEDGTYYMIMEYAPGGTLKDRILGDGPLTPRTAAEFASQIAEALGVAHGRGLIHRDVKPQNILLTGVGDAKVADFGIARAATATTTSRSELILGTACYVSPEQAKGEPAGPRSDLYSLGVVLYEMLTGEVPYGADTSVAVAMKHVTEPPRPPREANPEVPEGIDAITLRLLAKDPAERYGSAAELVGDLRRVANGLSPAFADADPAAANRTVLPAQLIPANPGREHSHVGPAVIYGRHFGRLPSVLATGLVALLVLLGAASWGPWWDSEEHARAQDVASGSLDEFGEDFEGGERASGTMKTISNAENLPEDEGRESSTTDTDSPELGNVGFVSSDAVLQNDVINGDPAVGNPMERSTELEATPGSEPERVNVPDVSGGSAEEAASSLSDAGHVVLGTAERHSSEPAGTAVGTDLPTGSAVERGTPVLILVSSGPASQDTGTGDEDAAPTPAPEATPAPRQPSKTGKRDPKALTATFAKGEPVSAMRPGKVAASSSSAQALANQR